MSNIVIKNIHLLQTLSDKSLTISSRQQFEKALPFAAFVALREIFFNVAIGNVKGFPPKIADKLHQHRLLVFKIVDENQELSDLERKNLLGLPRVLGFLASVLPSILKIIQSEKTSEDDNNSSLDFTVEEEEEEDDSE